MKHQKKILFSTLVFLFTLFSCNDTCLMEEGVGAESGTSVSIDDNLSLKKDFSIALAKVLSENQDVRDLIKKEALKKIDFDYDVLYQLVNKEELSEGKTLEQLMLKYLSVDKLSSIKNKMPTLTIFVPSLPNDSFSAEEWDVKSQVPFVAVRAKETNDVIYYNNKGEEGIISQFDTPEYPIVVVKENERIVLQTNSSTAHTRSFSAATGDKVAFVFCDKVFDNITKVVGESERKDQILISSLREVSTSRPPINSIPERLAKIYDSYDVYKNNDGWQRDYVYYNITPVNVKGPFDYNYKEHLLSFQMCGDPITAINKIADQTGDPRYDGKDHKRPIGDGRYIISNWTDGEFEFKVKMYLGGKGVVSELITYFRAKPEDLFSVKSMNRGDVTMKAVPLFLPLFEWNLENYASSIKIAIEEVDALETIEQTISTTNEFASNFSYDATFGEVVKNGLKFGASQKETRTVSYKVSTTKGNDELGEVIVNFADDIIMSRNHIGRNQRVINPDYNNKYTTGWYKIHIAPCKTN